jgi:hypothetical protein
MPAARRATSYLQRDRPKTRHFPVYGRPTFRRGAAQAERRQPKRCRQNIAERDTYQISQPFVYEAIVLEPAQFVANSREAPRRVTQGNTKLFSIFSVPPAGGERHELSSKEIVVHALNIAFFSTLVMAFVVVVLTGTFRLFQ